MSAIKKSARASDTALRKSIGQAPTKAKAKVSFKSAEIVEDSDSSSSPRDLGFPDHLSHQPRKPFAADKPILPNSIEVTSREGVTRKIPDSSGEESDNIGSDSETSDVPRNADVSYNSPTSRVETPTRRAEPTSSQNHSAIKPLSVSNSEVYKFGRGKTLSSKPRSKPSGSEEEDDSSDASEKAAGQAKKIDGDDREDYKSDDAEDTSTDDAASPPSPQARGKTSSPKAGKNIPLYKPPSYVERATVSSSSPSQIEDIFAPSNIKGKQLWHIAAPSSIPLALVKEISSQDILSGSTVLSHEGAEYGFITTDESTTRIQKTLLIPSTSSNRYHPSKVTIAKTLQLQQQVKLPNRIMNTQASVNDVKDVLQLTSKPLNQQPEGLKMRYHAFGLPGSGASDSESGSDKPALNKRLPAPRFIHSNTLKASNKRKYSEHIDKIVTPPSTTSKPKKKFKAALKPNEGSSLVDKPEISPLLSSNRQSSSVNGVPSSHETLLPKKKETKEKRAKRKVENHQKRLLQPFQVPQSVSPAKVWPEEKSRRKAMITRRQRMDHRLQPVWVWKRESMAQGMGRERR